MAEVNRLWSAARRIQKEGLRRPRSQRTSHRRADGGADEEEGGRGQGTERDATIDGQQIIHNTPTRKRATKHKTFTPRTHQASFTSHQHANQGLPPLYRAPPSPPKRPSTTRDADGHTSTARSRRKSPRHRSNLKGRKSDSQLYGHHITYEPGELRSYELHSLMFCRRPSSHDGFGNFSPLPFPLGSHHHRKGPTGAFTGPRDSSPGTPCVPQLGARRAYPHAPARSRGFPPARERCRPPGAARRSRDSYASRKPSSAVTFRSLERLYPLPVRTILDRCTPQVGVR